MIRASFFAAGLAFALACFAATGANAAMPQLFGEGPLLDAIKKDSVEDVKAALLDEAQPNQRTSDGTPTLVLAVSNHNLEIIALLIDAGARVDIASTDGTTPLTLAAANGDSKIVSFLLEKKADIGKAGALRETAIIKAVRGRHEDVVKILLDAGADPNDTDQTGNTVLDIAHMTGQAGVADMLKKKGAT